MSTHLEDLENELVNHPQRVLVIAGAGVSMATDSGNPCAGWSGLLRHGVQWCRDRCPTLGPDWYTTIDALFNLGELIAIANMVTRELKSVRDGEYARWLAESVGGVHVVDNQVLQALVGWGVQIATTNYDTLIEQVSGRGAITWRDHGLALQFLRGDLTDVLHLHGHYQYPETVILDARTYEDICRDQSTQNNLRVSLTARTVVFVGCGAGLSDPNFGNLLAWSRQVLPHSLYNHYRLVQEPELRQAAEECRGLPIQPIPYGPNHPDLGPFLSALGERVRLRRTPTPELELLDRRQADYATQCRNLEVERTSLELGEYMRRRLELAHELWRVGGHRTAALDMNDLLFREGTNLSRNERMRFGLDVAEMLLDDELERYAASVLQRLLSDVEAPDIPAEAAGQFRRLHIRCMNELCAYHETLAAIDRALLLTMGEERTRLQAQRAEIQLLQGHLDEAVRNLDDGEVL